MILRGRAQRVLNELSYRELGNYYSELKCALSQRFSQHERERHTDASFVIEGVNPEKQCLNMKTR